MSRFPLSVLSPTPTDLPHDLKEAAGGHSATSVYMGGAGYLAASREDLKI